MTTQRANPNWPNEDYLANADALLLKPASNFPVSYERTLRCALDEIDRLKSELHRRMTEFDIEREATRRHIADQAKSLQGECPTGDYKQAEAIEPKGSRSESPAHQP